MQAIIEIKKGEQPYKIIRSPWLNDSQGPVMFKLLSKKCLDGNIESVYVVERRNGQKTVIASTNIKEDKFMDAANCFRQMIWKDFPQVDLTIEDIEPVNTSTPYSTSQYNAVKNTKKGIFWLKIKRWFKL